MSGIFPHSPVYVDGPKRDWEGPSRQPSSVPPKTSPEREKPKRTESNPSGSITNPYRYPK